jgi:hypothetical protein
MRLTVIKQIVLFSLGVALLTNSLVAQTANIYGVIADSVTKQRILSANVTIQNTMIGAASNSSGLYYISRIPPGTYQVEARVMGYQRVVRSVTVRENQTVELNFELPPTSIEFQEVLVNAPRKRLDLELSTSVHVIQKQELKAIPVAAQGDLLQSLKILPGIVSTSDVSSKFYVRGGAGDQNLFLYDGIRVYYPFHALGIFSSFNPNVVDNVEVYTGAFPPGYGGRLSSVVNIQTRDGRADRFSGHADVNFLSTEMAVEGPLVEGTSCLIDVRKSISSNTFGRILGQQVPVSFYDATVKLTAQPGGVNKFDATFLSSGDVLQFSSPDQPNYAWRNNGISVVGTSVPTEQVFLQWIVFGSIYTAEKQTKGATDIAPVSTTVKHYGLRTSATVYAGPTDLYYFGFEFGVPSMDYSFTNSLGESKHFSSNIIEPIVWLRYLSKIGDVEIDGGLHVEAASLLQGGSVSNDIQPRFNLSTLVAGTWRAKAAVGRFTQHMMTLTNEDDIMSLIDPWIRIPDNLPPEQADHYVLGLSGNLTELTTLNLETYYKHYGSLVAYNRDKVDAHDPDFVSATGQSYGIELMVRSKLGRTDLYGSYSLAWADLNNQGFVYVPRYDRRHHLNLMTISRLASGLSVTLRWEYGSGFPFSQTVGYYYRMTLGNSLPGPWERESTMPLVMLGPKNGARLPAYHRLDASAAYDFSLMGFNVSAGIDLLNLYDNKNIFYFDRTTGQSAYMLRFFPSIMLTIMR